MKNISIKWKIFSYLLLFSATLLLLLWLFQVVFLDQFYQSVKIKELQSTASAIEKSINEDDINHILKSLSKNKDISIEILSDNGASIYSYKISRDSALENMSVFEKINLLVKAKESGGEYLSPRTENQLSLIAGSTGKLLTKRPAVSMIMAKTLSTSEGQNVGLLISSAISPVDATVSTLRTQLYYITAFMILFSILLALLIARKVATPIETLNISAKYLANGNYTASFQGKGYREIDELSDTLNETASQLSKVEALRQELIANISHDLRTPLTLITGYAEIMRDIPGENSPENAQVIIDESKRLSTLVNDVLDLSKLQSDNEVFYMEPFPLTQNIRETVTRLNEFLKQEDIHIHFEPEREIWVSADNIKLPQVIYNLLINGINHTGADKKVQVLQKISSKNVVIEVTDSGQGIPSDKLADIWERYYQSDKNHQRPVTGSGLGLSIVKNIVEKHGGQCGVDSQIGNGSTFWFSLPLSSSLE